jgi:hypothetical protein
LCLAYPGYLLIVSVTNTKGAAMTANPRLARCTIFPWVNRLVADEHQEFPCEDGSFTTDAEIEKMIGPVGRTDLIGATVKGIGGYLSLVYGAESLSAMPKYLGDLLRRAA